MDRSDLQDELLSDMLQKHRQQSRIARIRNLILIWVGVAVIVALLIYCAWPTRPTASRSKKSVLNLNFVPPIYNPYSASSGGDGAMNVVLPTLSGNATPITSEDEWSADANVTDYRWLSNDTILFTRQNADTTTLWQYNVTTRWKIPITDDAGELYICPYVSPDGKWLLAQRRRDAKTGQTHAFIDIRAWRLNGSRVAQWRLPTGCAGWFNDSRHWFSWDDKHAFIHDVEDPGHTETVRIAPSNPLLREDLISFGNDYENIRCLSKSLLLVRTRLRTDLGVSAIEIFAGSLDADARHQRHYTVQAPAGFKIFDAVFSPDGTQIAWVLQHTETATVQLCVSQLDGSGMHALETLGEQVGMPFPILANRYLLRWRPDGTSLSFLYHHRLWVVLAAVEPEEAE